MRAMLDLAAPTEPTRAIAGDCWEWLHASAQYPRGDGWALAYRIAGPGVLEWDDAFAAAEGDGWRVRVLPTATAQLTAGTYQVFREFTRDDDRRTERVGVLVVPSGSGAVDDSGRPQMK